MIEFNCCICDGPLALLGALGNLTWFRCVNCGAEQSFNHDHEED